MIIPLLKELFYITSKNYTCHKNGWYLLKPPKLGNTLSPLFLKNYFEIIFKGAIIANGTQNY